jgi:Raf kinase inhibitor-like YbhB/YbcL family protein
MQRSKRAQAIALVLGGSVLCQAWTAVHAPRVEGQEAPRLSVRSTAFDEGGRVPKQYTCDGADVSPPLDWGGAPQKTRTFALVCNDPDAPRGDWVHWVIFDLPAGAKGLPANAGPQGREKLAGSGTQGRNDFGKIGYNGPCPPGGSHRYVFRLYALDAELSLAPGATRAELVKAMQGHILAQAQLTGTYARQ